LSIALILPAAGIGTRFSQSVKKQYYKIKDKPILYWTLKRFITTYDFNEIIVGIDDNDIDLINTVIKELGIDKKSIMIVSGGNTRAETVLNCLNRSSSEYACIHDAVRPFIAKEVILAIIAKGITSGAVITGIRSKDTVKEIDGNSLKKSIDRDKIFLVHTPQFFKQDRLIEAYKLAFEQGINITDDSSAYELLGDEISIVNSTITNIKITSKDDMAFANIYAETMFCDLIDEKS